MSEVTSLKPAPASRTEHFDVLIIGAGISGIGAAHHLRENCPGKSFAMLEAKASFGSGRFKMAMTVYLCRGFSYWSISLKRPSSGKAVAWLWVSTSLRFFAGGDMDGRRLTFAPCNPKLSSSCASE